MKQIFFGSGFPRSGSTLLTSILGQNKNIFSESSEELCYVIPNAIRAVDGAVIKSSHSSKKTTSNMLKGIFNGYYSQVTQHYIYNNSHLWILQLPVLEAIFEKNIKMIVTVRSPYEIIASFEKLRLNNPFELRFADYEQKYTSIQSRATFHSMGNGVLSLMYNGLRDCLAQGYCDRLLLIDYHKLCNNPEYQLKRAYNFLELPYFKHNFNEIESTKKNSDREFHSYKYTGMHSLNPKIQSNNYDYESIIGTDLKNFYNTSFWDDLT